MPADLSFARELPVTRTAISFARERHRDQRRDGDGAQFIAHPVEVAALLARSGYRDEVVAAAVLHDVLEDTGAAAAELSTRFGSEVCRLVDLVSDDPSIADEEERKADTRARVRRDGGDALAVYAADKVSKVRELRMRLAAGLDPERAEVKLRRYRLALEMLDEELADRRLVEVLRFELEALEVLPPERVAG